MRAHWEVTRTSIGIEEIRTPAKPVMPKGTPHRILSTPLGQPRRVRSPLANTPLRRANRLTMAFSLEAKRDCAAFGLGP